MPDGPARRGKIPGKHGWHESSCFSWRSERLETIDLALRSIRMAATHRIPLVVCGEGDLVPTARSIHRRTLVEQHAAGRAHVAAVRDVRDAPVE